MEKKAFTSPVSKPPTQPVVTQKPFVTMQAPQPVMPVMPQAKMPVQMPVQMPVMEKHEIKKWCLDHKHRYVLARTKDGFCCDGFVEHIDDEIVCLAVPHCEPHLDPRAFIYPPFYPYPPLYPYPFFPRRRFVRQVFPLAALLALSLLPYY